MISAISLFSGGGGFSLGMELAGVSGVAYVEKDKYAASTLRTNRPNWNVIEQDVTQVDFHPYAGVDLVYGGPPCQTFSYAGNRAGFADTRGTLFHEFARCIRETKPKVFLLENVQGLTTHDNGRTFQVIRETLGAAGYDLDFRVLDASKYGVGQARKRLILVGVREDIPKSFDFITEDSRVTTLRDALKDVPDSMYSSYSQSKLEVMRLVPPGGNWRSLPPDVAKQYMGKSYYSGGGRTGVARRLNWDAPSPTLTTSPSQKLTERCHPDETRPLTVREYARVQSFPDDWEFQGGITQQYKQIGNATPVELARRLGVQIVKLISD